MKFKVLVERASNIANSPGFDYTMKPIGQPVGGVQNPDWIKTDPGQEKYTCKKCKYPLLGIGYNFPNKSFKKMQKGTHLICRNCGHDNFIGEFEGYIKTNGKVDTKYFNRTTPVDGIEYGDGNAL